MAKSPDAFRTISEVSDWLDTPAHVLRFWESKFTQVKPVKRAGGRRYYRPEDMALLGGIKMLLHERGMTIKGVQKLLREQGAKHVSALGPQPLDDSGQTIPADFADLMIEDVAEAEMASADAPPVARLRSGNAVPGIPPRPAMPQDESGQSSENDTDETAATPPIAKRPAFAGGADPSDPWPLPPPPPPDDIAPRPVSAGLLSAIIHTDPTRIRARRTRIAPLVQRLDRLRDRMQRDRA